MTCAGKGLKKLPQLLPRDRLMCKLLILDLNEITDFNGFNENEWPQLEEIRVNKNPVEMCDSLGLIKHSIKSSVVIKDDCDLATVKPELDKSLFDVSPAIDHVVKMIKTESPETEKESDETDPGNEIVTTTLVKGYESTTVPMDYETGTLKANYDNVTGVEGWGLDMSASKQGLALIITVPISFFGIAIILFVKVYWRVNNPKCVSISVDTRPRTRGCFSCCCCKKRKQTSGGQEYIPLAGYGPKHAAGKSSPTPSHASSTSNVVFDIGSASAVHRKKSEGMYSDHGHIF